MRIRSILIVGLILLSFAGTIAYPASIAVAEKNQGLESVAESQSDLGLGASVASLRNSDSFVMATYGEPETIDPANNWESRGLEIVQNVYETLVWYDGERVDRFVPMLATSVPTVENGGISTDGLQYVFELRPGVKFHDGTIMDAYDVEYSLERVLTMNGEYSPAWMLGQVMIPGYAAGVPLDPVAIADSVVVTGPLTVVINLVRPYAPFMQILAFTVCSIVSMEYVEDHGGVEVNTLNEWMARNECGTGPFMLNEWASYSYVKLERFDDYWRDPAKLKYVTILNVDDLGTREMMLFSGDADSIALSVLYRSDVIGQPGIRVVEGRPTFNIWFQAFNQDIVTSPSVDIGNISSTFFQDINVRDAFVHSFDYDKYLADFKLGTAIQPRGVIPLGMFGYNSSVPLQEFNLTKAADALHLAINGSSGKSYAEEGFRMVLYYNVGNTGREYAANLFKEGLESLSSQALVEGQIIVDVYGIEWPTYLGYQVNRQLPIFYYGWMPDYPDPDDYTVPFYQENSLYATRMSLQNHTLSVMVDEASMELNSTLREKMYYEIEMAVYNNSYFSWMAHDTSFHVERDWVTGYYFNPMYMNLYYYALGIEMPWADAPQNVTMTSTIDRITLEWDPPQWPGSSPITSYSIYRATEPGGPQTYIGSAIGMETVYVDNTTQFGVTYYHSIVAVNSYGEGISSAEASCPVFTNLPNDAVLNAYWYYTPIMNQPIDVWQGSTNAAWLSFSGADGTFQGTPDVVGSYWLNVSGSNQNGLAYLNYTVAVVDVVPLAPQDLQAASSVGQVLLTWAAPSYEGGSPITGYVVYRGEYSGGEAYLLSLGDQLSYVDTSVIPGTTYFYKVSAANVVGEGPQSYEASATVPTVPSAPQNVRAIPGNGQVTLTWSTPADNGGTPITGYNVYRGTTPGGEVYLKTVTGTSTIDTGLTSGWVYYYEISAVNAIGEGPLSGEVRATVPMVPFAPQNLKATAGNGQVTLTWSAPASDGGSTITSYLIYRGTSSGGESYLAIVDGGTRTYTDNGVTNGQTYYYKVSAVNSVGGGPSSGEVSATPILESVPSKVLNLQISPGDGKVTLTWSAPSDDKGSEITGYKIYRGTTSGGLTYLATVSGTSYTDSGLTNGQTYYYKVSPINANGEGLLSNEVNAMPESGIGGGQLNPALVVGVFLAAVVGLMVVAILIVRPGK